MILQVVAFALFIISTTLFILVSSRQRKAIKQLIKNLNTERAARAEAEHLRDVHMRDCALMTESNYKKSDHIIELEDQISELTMYKDRALDLEAKIGQDFGVDVRKEITVIKADFNKVEMVTMFSGIFKLLNSAKGLDDVMYYTNLAKKIQGFIDQMTEEQESDQP